MQGLQFRPSGVVLLYFEHRPELCNAAVGQEAIPKLPILIFEPLPTGVSTFSGLRSQTGKKNTKTHTKIQKSTQKGALFTKKHTFSAILCVSA
jgi:hypothetical protein